MSIILDFSISACPLFGVQFNDNPKNKTLAFNNKTITCYRFILPCKKKKATMIFLSLWLLSFYDKPKTPCFSAFLQYKRTQRLYHSLGAFMVEAVQQNANLQFLHRHCLLSPIFSRNSIAHFLSIVNKKTGSTKQEISCCTAGFSLFASGHYFCIT